MKAYLRDGPANGRVITHPQTMFFRIPIPKPIDSLTVQSCLQESLDPALAMPNYDIATYEFTQLGHVNLQGELQFVVYEFKGMESA